LNASTIVVFPSFSRMHTLKHPSLDRRSFGKSVIVTDPPLPQPFPTRGEGA
jgi:hypothetical protein